MEVRADEELRREIGARVRSARLAVGVSSLRQFAGIVGIDPSQLSRLETGERLPDAGTLLRLRAALKVSIDWLLTGQAEVAGPLPVASSPPGLDLAFSGFRLAAHESGLTLWATGARRDDAPTVGEALQALDAIRRNPELSESSGHPKGGWTALLKSLRSRKPKVPGEGDRVWMEPEGSAYEDRTLERRVFGFRDLTVRVDLRLGIGECRLLVDASEVQAALRGPVFVGTRRGDVFELASLREIGVDSRLVALTGMVSVPR